MGTTIAYNQKWIGWSTRAFWTKYHTWLNKFTHTCTQVWRNVCYCGKVGKLVIDDIIIERIQTLPKTNLCHLVYFHKQSCFVKCHLTWAGEINSSACLSSVNHDTWFWCLHLLKSKLSLIYSREPLSPEASIEGGSHETDFTDHGPGVAEPLQTGTQVTSLRSQLGLDRDGAFLDAEKYDPIKHLGSGGFAKARLHSTYTLVLVTAIEVAEISLFHDESQKKINSEKHLWALLDAPPTEMYLGDLWEQG